MTIVHFDPSQDVLVESTNENIVSIIWHQTPQFSEPVNRMSESMFNGILIKTETSCTLVEGGE